MNIKAYFHKKGNPQSEFHSEYEIEIDELCIFTVHNGIEHSGGQITIIDEKKALYIIANCESAPANSVIWAFSDHSSENKPAGGVTSKKVTGEAMLSRDIGAMILPIYLEGLGAISIRRNDQIYFAIDGRYAHSAGAIIEKIMKEDEPVNLISFKDLLEYISCDIEWKKLKKRATIATRHPGSNGGSFDYKGPFSNR
jgi:hypothetical protein